jgi:hypothetical protein
MSYHYGTPASPQSCAATTVTDFDLSDFNVFEFTWQYAYNSSTDEWYDTFNLYAKGNTTPISTLSTDSGTCSGAPLLTIPMDFVFDQENYTGGGNSNMQSDLSWVSDWS